MDESASANTCNLLVDSLFNGSCNFQQLVGKGCYNLLHLCTIWVMCQNGDPRNGGFPFSVLETNPKKGFLKQHTHTHP